MNIIIPKESYQKLGANTVFIIPASYCNYWNFNQFMGGQNMSNLPILASFMPQWITKVELAGIWLFLLIFDIFEIISQFLCFSSKLKFTII